MNKKEELALFSGAIVGLVVGWRLVRAFSEIYDENLRLKNDNTKMLVTMSTMLDHIDRPEDLPEEIITDLQFRAMAFLTEHDDGGDDDA